ncbi:hypothetical protein [Afipia sp. DC4300-2b1]|uniref:hypothetical protein n=1 Tax=Afipia sp. DC4300-2b1 TaxID=2804672 RepID=UPI003CEB3107
MMQALLSATLDAASSYAGKTLAERVAGRFYTPDILATDLARRLVEALIKSSRTFELSRVLRVCDPFCGDGRLVSAFFAAVSERPELFSRRWVVTLRDIEADAARAAGRRLKEFSRALGLEAEVRVSVGDSFSQGSPALHDVVVTNPPWELLKPDSRELAQLSEKAKAAHRRSLRELCDVLDARFPNARANNAWGGWGTNLARCGWELALRSCFPGGVLGIVLPSTIMADQASANMRRSVFGRSTLVDLATYPPEARLFSRVDQPVVVATFVVTPPAFGIDAKIRTFNLERSIQKEGQLKLSESQLSAQDYALPVSFAPDSAELIAGLSSFPRFSDLEGGNGSNLWAGRELDETRILEKTVPGHRYPFIKGRMIHRHQVSELPRLSVRASLVKGFHSIAFERIVWRDVARSSQGRRMIGAIIPPGWVAGNSLHVTYFRDGDPQRLRALYAVLSSLIFEFQVRSRLATGHMSLGIVRLARVPLLSGRTLSDLAKATETILWKGEDDANLEVAAARAYGLTREQFAEIIAHFPKLDIGKREAMLAAPLWPRKNRK